MQHVEADQRLQVVGGVNILNRGERGFVWKNGVMTDLNTLISASGATVSGAFAINLYGSLIASGLGSCWVCRGSMACTLR